MNARSCLGVQSSLMEVWVEEEASSSASAKSNYLEAILCTVPCERVFLCLLPGVSCPDEMYSKVMALGWRCGSVISQTHSPGNL